jgi:glycosyltransferase involved in cell wall biosynthesis/GT2 family glycosyltransferase
MNLTVAIPSYGRNQVLVQTIDALLALDLQTVDLLLVDQTLNHDAPTEAALRLWQQEGRLRWLRLQRPSITMAMNVALEQAVGERVLFLDDDIIPDPNLLKAHVVAGQRSPKALLAGRVIQPWHTDGPEPEDKQPFTFNTLQPRECLDFIGCNFSLPRKLALSLGGFDNNFVRVAYRYEAEFAFRWRRAGYPVRYEPAALIRHLKTERGGTRSYGEHLATIKPDHAVGRYYYRLRTQSLAPALAGSLLDLVRSVRTRHHLRHPWWMPLTIFAEMRGLFWALRLHSRGPALLSSLPSRLLIASSHPIQYHSPLFRLLSDDPAIDSDVLYLTLPSSETQGLGFGKAFTWDVPLLEGYRWHQAISGRGLGITSGYRGVWLRNPGMELGWAVRGERPAAFLLTGWHFLGLLQLFIAAKLRRIPVLLRMDSNNFRPRSWILNSIYRLLFMGVDVVLTVGTANARWCRLNGIPPSRMVPSPHFVDNAFFSERAAAFHPQSQELRRRWQIPSDAFCFLFAGKLQPKKRPQDLLEAFALVQAKGRIPGRPLHLLIVGTGEMEASCRSQVEALQLPISFVGFLNQSEIPGAYAVSDCLVLPSDHGESWGLVVNEAMACGLPAIVSDLVGCAEDLVLTGVTGDVVPCGNPEALAQSLISMAANPERAARMGEKARELVLAKYTIEAAAEGIRKGLSLLQVSR